MSGNRPHAARRVMRRMGVAWPVLLATVAGCSERPPPGFSGAYGFSAVVFVQRPHLANAGSLLAPDRFVPGGNALLLEPAALGGRLMSLTALEAGDVAGLDASPDGRRVVAAVRSHSADRYHLVEMDLEMIADGQLCFEPDGDVGSACRRLTFGPADDTRPVYLPDGRIAFLRAAPNGPFDFQGRGRARVLFAVDPDSLQLTRLDFGPGTVLGARQLPDGWLRAVRWTSRQGQDVFLPVRLDPSASRGVWPDGPPAATDGLPLWVERDDAGQLTAACVSSLGTWATGTICRRDDASGDWRAVVRAIPPGAGCSPEGRVRDPYPLDAGRFLVSYARVRDGCVNYSDGDFGLIPDFGIAVLDAFSAERFLVFNDPQADEALVRPVGQREALDPGVVLPARPDLGCEQAGMRIEGFVGSEALAADAVRLRVMQSLSGALAPWAVELGGREVGAFCAAPEGGATEAPVYADGSFAVRVPAGVPLRLQVVDRYAATLSNDPLWRGGPPCARRACAGCHANDGQPVGFADSLAAGQPEFGLHGADDLQRDFDFRRDVQPVLDRSCALGGCHDASTAAGAYVDLAGNLRGLDLSPAPAGRTSVAYQNLMFVDRRRDAATGRILEARRAYVVPGRARDSSLIQRLGVPCRFDCQGAPDWAEWGMPADRRHPEDQPGWSGTFTDEDRWRLVEWIDAGAPFLGRGAEP